MILLLLLLIVVCEMLLLLLIVVCVCMCVWQVEERTHAYGGRKELCGMMFFSPLGD